MINVTKTFLPPIEEYQAQVQRAWDNEWLTNRGQLVRELEGQLQNYLAVPNIILTNNGTVPLQIALKLLGNVGEIITTPFSYVATTAAIVWQNCIPVFVDIHPEYLTIDETKIEASITDKTTAILATHVFGNPCNVEEIESIAKKYNLKVIYDAAHAFGVKYKGKSIFTYGDVSTCSFHATKLFHTGEGGAMFTNDEELHHKLFYSHNFGHKGPLDFYGLGINGKLSEIQAALGLSVFPYLEFIIESRKEAIANYDALLDFSKLRKLRIREGTEWNYSYYPILFNSEEDLIKADNRLKENQIVGRRYFYPSLNTLNYLNSSNMPVAENIASKVFCLPLFAEMELDTIKVITKILNSI